jgi:transposase
VRVLVATKPVDFRRGAESLAALVREQLRHDPFSGTIFILRSKRADRLKIPAEALEMIGPTPGTVIKRWQLASWSAKPSISAETVSMRSLRRRQSWTRSAIRLTILGESTSALGLRIPGSALRNGITP